jgi:alkylated DNA nucleotide flippase Atl1
MLVGTSQTTPTVVVTQMKAGTGKPMRVTDGLHLQPRQDVSAREQFDWSPRQVCITTQESLDRYGVSHTGSRANLILRNTSRISPGTRLVVGSSTLRITMHCEPCNYGAKLAQCRMPEFRNIERYLAIVLTEGLCAPGDHVTVEPGLWPDVPKEFRHRAEWAVRQIPQGLATTSLDFLKAIGASPAYARVLPRWLHAAALRGASVHRVLTAHLTQPSWAPNAYSLLQAEGITDPLHLAKYDLTHALWFTDHCKATRQGAPIPSFRHARISSY